MAKSKEEQAAYQKEWYAKNKESDLAKSKLYRAANKEKLDAKRKIYRAENKEMIAATTKRWCEKNPDYQMLRYRENPEKVSNHLHRRRAKKEGNGIFVVTEKFMKKLYNSPCVSCGASERIEADHIIPISKGGRHSEGNLQPLCRSCNRRKATKLWIEFVAKKKGSQIDNVV